MKKIAFATNNLHKLEEVKSILENHFSIVSLAELNCFDDIPETASTLEGNALLKAQYIHQKFGVNCFADDTGLEVEALNGAPGVYSARYAGETNDAKANMQKLLDTMSAITNRNAQFRTVISLILNNETYFFEGIIKGTIAHIPIGNEGFGYDPIFVPDGYTSSFAQLGIVEKNKISHRAQAVQKLSEFLKNDEI